MATILVDFDGTCIPALPMGGYASEYDTGAEKILKKLQKAGHKIVLWTVRNNSQDNPYNVVSKEFNNVDSLTEASNWFKERGISLHGVNKVPDEVEKVGTSRKILGDFLIDDTAIGAPIKFVTIDYYSYLTDSTSPIKTFHIDWDKIEELLIELELL